MKTLCTLLLSAGLSVMAVAQSLNNDGLYVSADGNLFTGKMVKMQNENKVELSVKEGKAEGPAFYYYASGRLMETGSFAQGEKHDKWVRYNEKGGIAAIAFYNLGKKTGTWLVYDDKGNRRLEMNYSDGAKSGVWTSWDENGQVASTKDYSKVN